jgi:hypothetical protein
MPTKKVVKETSKNHDESVFDAVHVSIASASPSIKKRALIGGTLTIIVIFLTGLNYFWHYQQKIQKNPVMAAEKEQQSIVANVSKLIELPSNEQPTIATVTDITKLKGQQFFQNAKNGDIVLIYSKANEAILYDPMMNKILVTGPLAINQTSTNASVAGASTQAGLASPTPAQVMVALYNGTTIPGLTRKIETELSQAMPNATVVENTNASKQDYTNTIVIDLTHKNAAAAQQLIKVLHGTAGSMPSNESVPVNADILVILGTTN